MNPQNQSDLFQVCTVYNPSNEPFEVFYNSEKFKTIPPRMAVQIIKMIAGNAKMGAVKHLVDRMIRQEGLIASLNDPVLRAKWEGVILVHTAPSIMPAPQTESEKIHSAQKQAERQAAPVLPPTPTPTHTPNIVPANANDKAYIEAGYKFHPVDGHELKAAPTGISAEQVDISKIQMAPDNEPTPNIAVSAALPTDPLHPETNTLLDGIRNTDTEGSRVIGEAPIDEAPPAPDTPTRPENPTREDLMSFAKEALFMDVNDPSTRSRLDAMDVPTLIKELKYDRFA